jgi:hypothetical protein
MAKCGSRLENSTIEDSGMSSGHFIVYAARQGARNFFDGISDPTFFKTINKILDDGFYLGYIDPRHGEAFEFGGLKEFVVHEEGLGIPDWLPFMKALKAQDEGSEAKELYWRMVRLDEGLDPLVGSAKIAPDRPLLEPRLGGPGRGHKSHDNIMAFQGTSQDYLLRRIARDQPKLLEEIGHGKRFKSARAAAIEAGIITPFPSLQLKEPVPTAQKLLAKKGKEWCLQLLDELSALVFED